MNIMSISTWNTEPKEKKHTIELSIVFDEECTKTEAYEYVLNKLSEQPQPEVVKFKTEPVAEVKEETVTEPSKDSNNEPSKDSSKDSSLIAVSKRLDAGESLKDIAQDLGIKYNTLYDRLSRAGIRLNKAVKKVAEKATLKADEIQFKYAMGSNINELAKEYNVTHQVMRDFMMKNKIIKSDNKTYDPEYCEV